LGQQVQFMGLELVKRFNDYRERNPQPHLPRSLLAVAL